MAPVLKCDSPDISGDTKGKTYIGNGESRAKHGHWEQVDNQLHASPIGTEVEDKTGTYDFTDGL